MNRCETQFGRRLRQLRRERGWTLRELARRAHLGLSTVHLIERRGRVPRRSTARRLVIALGFSWTERRQVFPEIR